MADPAIRIISEAANGLAALELIQQTRPVLDILDIHMPKLNGFALARALQQQQLNLLGSHALLRFAIEHKSDLL